MANPVATLHKIVSGTKTYYAKLPDNYTGLGTVTGVTKGVDADKNEPATDLAELIKVRAVQRITCGYQVGGAGKVRYVGVIVAAAKVATAIADTGGLIGSNITIRTNGPGGVDQTKTGEITSIVNRRRAVKF